MRTLLRLLTYLRPHRKRLAVTYICIAVVTVLNLLIPWVIKQVIDVGLASGSQRYMVQAALVVVAIAAARMIFSFGQRFGMDGFSPAKRQFPTAQIQGVTLRRSDLAYT